MGSLAALPQIPTPIAPARPITSPVGSTIPFTTSSGQSALVDSVGNLWSEAGQYLGKWSGSATGTSSPTTAASSTPSGGYGQMAQQAIGAVTKAILPWSGIDLEDTIFIVVGLILVAAAVFSFKETQTAVKTVIRTTGRAAEVAA